MRLVKLRTETGSIYINPDHVVAIHKALRNTTVDTLAGPHLVIDTPGEVARLLGSDEVTIDVTPKVAA